MVKIDIEYVKKLFDYTKRNESLIAPHTIKPSDIYDEVHKGLGPFLDTVCEYADSLDIPEFIVTEQYTENRYYYNIKYGKTVLEIGTYYNYDSVYVEEAGEYDKEFLIDCEEMLARNKNKSKKGLILEPQQKNKEEDK